MMPDIAKCGGDGCEMRKKCYRFPAPDSYWQTYMETPPVKDGKCDYFWNNNKQDNQEKEV